MERSSLRTTPDTRFYIWKNLLKGIFVIFLLPLFRDIFHVKYVSKMSSRDKRVMTLLALVNIVKIELSRHREHNKMWSHFLT